MGGLKDRLVAQALAEGFVAFRVCRPDAVPQVAVHPDLVDLAGGAEALVARAREKFGQGRPQEALHLLDIVRGAGADCDASRQLGIEVHQSLLAESENFWLSSWLRHQVKSLGA